ncbi:MAG: GntR family transcriptional regulator [Hyphomicrobiales bacterium]
MSAQTPPGKEAPADKLREKAYRSFTQHLLAHDVRPGQFVSQRELVELTGMPLGAIRELVPRLEAEGLITTIPKRGMQIASLDLNLVRDAYQFRLIVEKEAVAHFIKSASEEEIRTVEKTHFNILEEAKSGPITAELEARAQTVDWSFHDLIVDAMQNEIVSKAYQVNSIKIRLIRKELTRIDGHVISAMTEHMSIVGAIVQRDTEAAISATARHIQTARDRAIGL